ncbi:hypothetical protein J6590_091982, partial [Homalodisca vitripennis]
MDFMCIYRPFYTTNVHEDVFRQWRTQNTSLWAVWNTRVLGVWIPPILSGVSTVLPPEIFETLGSKIIKYNISELKKKGKDQ